MNETFSFYQEKNDVCHISGYNFRLEVDITNKNTIYFSRLMFCLGCGTEKDIDKLLEEFMEFDINKFNFQQGLLGYFFSQVLANQQDNSFIRNLLV